MWTRAVIWLVFAFALSAIALAQAQVMIAYPPNAPTVIYVAPNGGIPGAIVVKSAVSNDSQVCAEPAVEGVLACRSAAEFRVWVAQRPGIKR